MAPRRGARVVKVDHVINYENLTVTEVLCPICRSILIEPVTLPCNHVFCSSCFQGTMENANLVCPLCRIRIGSWLRSSKKDNKLINIDYWNAIKKLFPIQIKNKLEGVEENLDYEAPLIRLAKPGELKKEYETQIQKESEALRKEREAEAVASQALIKKLREEEEFQKIVEEEKMRLDETIAKKLAEELNCIDKPSQSSNKTTNNTKIGPLDRFLKYKYLKNKADTSSKDDQSKKIDFSKKEFTCRILCHDTDNNSMNWNSSGKKMNSDVNLTNLNLLNKKISAELERVIEVEGNSDSSDSIDSEYRYFKPVDYRRNPPCQKSTPRKVPTIKPKVIQNKIIAPKGQNTLRLNSCISAFAIYNDTSVVQKEELPKLRKTTKQLGRRRKSASPEKKQTPVRVKSASPEKRSMETRLRAVNAEKKNNNIDSHENTSNKSNNLLKVNSPKRKLSNVDFNGISPRKKNRIDLDDCLIRSLRTPSSPFRGFPSSIVNKKTPTKTPPRNNRRVEQLKSPQKTTRALDKERMKLQLKADFELAKMLQKQFDSVSYPTRSSAPRKNKVTRQTTLDNMLLKKSYKVWF